LTRRLNRMAEQFQALLHAYQQVGMLEERNRLARDLHDSVKQQVFAISMLVNSAKGMLRSDIDRTQICLDETDAFVQHVQQELTSLVGVPVAVRQKTTFRTDCVLSAMKVARGFAQKCRVLAV
jgi:signal transduction histidine kinase